MASGVAALVVRGTGQRRGANHVACGIDVRDDGLHVLIDGDVAALVGLDANLFQPESVGVSRATGRPQQGIRLELLARLEVQDHAIISRLDPLGLLAMADDDASFAQVITEGIDDLFVEEVEQPVAVVDEVHFDFEVAEHRRVLASDDTRADDGDRLHVQVEIEHRVAVEDARVSEVDPGRAVRTRSRGENDVLAPQLGV